MTLLPLIAFHTMLLTMVVLLGECVWLLLRELVELLLTILSGYYVHHCTPDI